MRHLPTVGAIGAVALVLTGCANTAGAQAPAADGLQIVATTTQLADVTRELVGDSATVTSLLQPGATAHSFDPGPAALSALAEADLLIVNGAGLEGWLDDTVEASGFAGTLVDTSASLDLLAAGDDPHAGHDHGTESTAETSDQHSGETADEHAAHADEHAAHAGETTEATTDEHAGESAEEHAAHAGHDHGAFDPHVWNDPANVALQAQTIVDAVTAADPESDIEASATAYLGRLQALETWMHGSIDQVPVEERLAVTTHDTFAYLERAFDVQVVGTVLPSTDDNAEASAAHIDALVAEIKETGAPVVFSESAIDPQLAVTIAREAGVELREGADALAADALGPAGSDTDTYIAAMVHNTTALVTAWGAQPLPVPESLS